MKRSAQRAGTPLSIAVIDLDFFKRISDTYGHPAGDEVLKSIAIAFGASIRHIDSLGRFGGEQFILILPRRAATYPARVRYAENAANWLRDLSRVQSAQTQVKTHHSHNMSADNRTTVWTTADNLAATPINGRHGIAIRTRAR